jgi:hypothetical protein
MFPDCEKFPTDDLVHGMEIKSAVHGQNELGCFW